MSDGLPITPYGDLVEGDEFIRAGGRPVLIRETAGNRTAFDTFTPDCMPVPFAVRVMVRNEHGILQERFVGEPGIASLFDVKEKE